MRILRLSNSQDIISTVPDEGRVYRIIERTLSAELGAPVETVVKRIEPRDTIAAIIVRWVRETGPDIVLLLVNQYWYGFPSAPERMEQMGRLGKILAKISYKAANTPWIAHNAIYRWLRSLVRGAIGTTYLYEPEQVVRAMEAVLEAVTSRYPRLPIGIWSEPVAGAHDLDRKLEAEIQERRRRVHEPLAAFCRERDIPHDLRMAADRPFDWKALRDADHLHFNAAGHEWFAEEQLPLVRELAARARRRADAG